MKHFLLLVLMLSVLAGCATSNLDDTGRNAELWPEFERYLEADDELATAFAEYAIADGNKAFARYIEDDVFYWWATGYADDKLDLETAEALALDLCHYFGEIATGCEVVHRQAADRPPLTDELLASLPDSINSFADAERFEAYQAAPDHKAIAGNEHGLYGYMIGADSRKEAEAFALLECTQNKPDYGSDCAVIASD